jgi:threonine/homoserine/homoserine lactone efflux protein
MMSNLMFLLLAALPLMGSPGPATLSLASLGAAFGFRGSLLYLLGIITGTSLVLLIVATGATTILTISPLMLKILQTIAGAYILYLAWKIATAPISSNSKRGTENTSSLRPSFWAGLGLAIANPKAFAAIGAVYGGHMLFPAETGLDALAKILALSGMIILVNTVWLAFGAGFSSVLKNPRLGRAINIAFAIMLVTSVVLALMAG